VATRSNPTRRNFKRAAKAIEEFKKGMKKRAPSGLRVIGEEVMLDVKMSRPGRGVPVRKGVLRSTGRVEGPKNDEVTLSFGGAAAPYALEQHENLSLHHRVGEARFLVRGLARWKAHGISVSRAFAEMKMAVDKAVAAAKRKVR